MAITKTRRRPAYHHGSLREALIERGGEIIERDGIAGLTLRAVAEAAGVSRQAPYHHFGDKDGLLAAIAVAGFTQLAELLRIEAARHSDSAERLVALGVAYVGLARRAPQRFHLCSGIHIRPHSGRSELARARDGARAVLDQAVAEYLAVQGVPEVSPAVAGAAAWAMAHGLARLLLEQAVRPGKDGLPSEEQLMRQSLAMLATGMTSVHGRWGRTKLSV